MKRTFILFIFLSIVQLSCKPTYEPPMSINDLITLLETGDEQFVNEITTKYAGWKRYQSEKTEGFTYIKGDLILAKPSKREILLIDQSPTQKEFLRYIKSLTDHPTKEKKINYFTYRDNYLVYYKEDQSPVDIMVVNVY